MSNKIVKFDYQGVPISFEFEDGNKMINATEMAKPFGKLVGNFLKADHAKEYIILLEDRYSKTNIGIKREVIRIVKGGDAINAKLQGTWMEEKLALKFAAWLSPEFELWVYDKIDELLKTGKVELDNHRPSSNLIKSIRLIADQLEAHEMDIQRNKEDIDLLKDSVDELNAKITSIDESYYSVSGYCSLNAILCPQEQARKWGLAATKLSHKKKMPIGKAYDAKFGDVNTYHIDILEEIISK